MGFHDVEWAYSIDRPLAETAVLAALCHRTDDETHETFVGQHTIAEMIGSSPEKVMRALRALEDAGVIDRQRRNDARGYRTSDLITVNVAAYQAKHLPGETPSRTNAYKENRRGLGDFLSPPTRRKVTAEDQPEEKPEDQPEPPPSPDDVEAAFEAAYVRWPKHEQRKKSLASFRRATKVRGSAELLADVLRFADAFAASTEKRFVPALCVWLNGERWTDELPVPSPPTDEVWNAFVRDETPESDCSGGHRWMLDGTCNLCPARRDRIEAGAA